MERWIDQELAGCEFADERLGRRFGVLMEQFSRGIGRTIPLACGDWAATKAALDEAANFNPPVDVRVEYKP